MRHVQHAQSLIQMTQIINLRTRRKQAARVAARRTGDANAAAHGLSKAQKTLAHAKRAQAEAKLDGNHLDRRPGDGPQDD